MWPSAFISSTHSILTPPFTVVAIPFIPPTLQNSVPLLEWQQVHLSSCPLRKWSKLAGTAQWVQQTGSWPMAQQKQIASLANGATQMQILTLKRQYFSQRSSRASLWGERKRGTTEASKVCICWHLNQVISCTRNIKLTTEAKLLLICYFKVWIILDN